MKTIRIEEMTWFDIQKALEKGYNTVVVAVGSMEQHGPHLPIITDTLIGRTLAFQVAKQLNKTLYGPDISIGCSDHHLAFPGTVSIKHSTLKAIIADYVDSMAKHGFKNIVFIPSHGGNFKTVEQAVQKMQEKYSDVNVIAFTDLFKFLDCLHTSSKEAGVTPEVAGAHAGENEASLVLAIDKSLVHNDRFEAGYIGSFGPKESEIVLARGMRELTENGILGDPTTASEEKGKKYLQDLVNYLTTEINKMIVK